MKDEQQYEEMKKYYVQRWFLYGIGSCFLPLVFFHFLGMIITAKLSLENFLIDFLLLVFFLALTVFCMSEDFTPQRKSELQLRMYITVWGGVVFYFLHIVFLYFKSIDDANLIFYIASFFVLTIFIVHECLTGKIIRLWQASDAMELEELRRNGSSPKVDELAEEKNEN